MSALSLEVTRLSRSLHALKTQLAGRYSDSAEWSSYVLLSHLVRVGPQRPSALAEVMHTDPSTVSRQVADLLRLGLADRRADPLDRRAWLIQANDAGNASYQVMCTRRDAMFGLLVADWESDEIQTLTALLGRLSDSLSHQRTQLLGTLDSDVADAGPSKGTP